MRQTSRRWRTGWYLAAAILGGSLLGLPLQAQSPGSAIPTPGIVPRSSGTLPTSLATGSTDPDAMTGLPTSGPRTGAIQRQGDLLRYSRNVPGDAKPIVLEANEVFTWNENGQVVFLLTGQVLVQQSVVQVRCDQAIAWVNTARYQQTGILHMDLYAEGKVRLDTSVEIQDGNRAALDFNTRGEFRVRGSRGKVQRQERSREPIVVRASELGFGSRGRPGATAGVPRTSPPPAAVLPPVPGVSPSPGSVIQPTGGSSLPPVPGVGGRPLSSLETKPTQSSSLRPRLVRAQGKDPAPVPGVQFPLPSPAAGTPAPSPASPGNVLPTPPPPVPLPPPPSMEGPARRDAQRQPTPEPGGAAPLPQLPPPTPGGAGPSTTPLPLPPPSRPAEPVRPGQLPKQSTPERPLAHRLLPRSGDSYNLKIDNLPDGRKVITATGGVILNVRNVPKIGILDVEADRAVVWVKNSDKGAANKVADNLRSEQGETSTELEFYMAGHVILRSNLTDKEKSVLEAEELYYDARRNVAVALQSRLELQTQRLANNNNARLTEPIILSAPELFRTGPNTFEVTEAKIFSSKLPSDPGLQLLVAKATLTNRERPRTFFGQPVHDKKGNPVMIEESIVEAKNVVAELEGVPFFYTPYLITDARDPLGPLETINLGGNRVFGFQSGVGLNVYKLFGVEPIEGTRWRFLADYLSRRGPALGTNFNYNGVFEGMIDPEDPYNTRPYYEGLVRAYGIYDQATDILGGNRPPTDLTFDPPGYRGRTIWRQGAFDMTYGFDVVAQMSLLSDRNFLEQYFKREFDSDPNQANFLFVKQQQDNWAWYAMGQARTSEWITTTQWLPRADAFLLGQDLFGLFTSNTQVSLGYASLRLSSDPPLPLQGAPNPPGYPEAFYPTDRNNDTGRFAILQELGLPLDFGAIRLEPYAKGALVEYTNTPSGDEIGRAWGGVGARASLPLTRLYPEVQSELFNLQGLNHKMVFGGNYFFARSNEPYTRFAQLDRLNDDATAQMLREFTPYQPVYNPQAGIALATSPYYNTQNYAIRRLVDNRIDTLEGIQVFQFDLRQRLQTKRGFPGFEHIVDWMTLDTSFSYFPQPTRDNFGSTFSFLEYQYNWNIGDRTSLESYGWYDPQDDGARVFTVGGFFNRPDRTSFYLGYRQIDPLQSRMVMAAVTYTFSPKYGMTLATSYDFGTSEAQTNTVVLTRTGTDLQVSLGFMYNSLQNNFGAIVEIVPSLLPTQRSGRGVPGMASAR